jgi:cytochrome P450
MAATAIPGPRGRFFTGNWKEARERPLEFVLEVTREHGDVAQVRMGPMRLVVVNHPEHVKRVLQEKSAIYGRPPFVAMMRRMVGNGLLFSEGDFWLRQRRTMQPMFHKERIAGFAKTMGAAVARRIAAWRGAEGRTPIDVSKEMAELTFEIVGRTLFSTDLTAEAKDLGEAIRTTLAWLDDRTQRPFAAPLFVPTAENRRFRAAQKLFTSTIDRLVAERRAAANDPGDLLSMLLAARDPETGEGMTDRQIHDEVLTFLIAGYETTSAALEWTLLLLSRNPEAADGVRAEQRTVCGERPPMPDDLAKMPYTRRAIDESLRIHPPVFGITRRAIEADEIGGFPIEKGAQVLVSPYSVHRHPAFWPDPERFDPDRFLPDRAKHRPRFAHFPFGGGPRQCIGNAFAMMELQVLVPAMIGALRFDLAEGSDTTPEPRMTYRPRGPVKMYARPA